jgi:formylglycine-generating enzyme required for sulfatase activity
MISVLHLSDLHFGYDRDRTARAQREEALGLLVKPLSKLEPVWKPQILVISGDLTWQGKPEGYTQLADWLKEKLFPATGLTASDCVICPGNHDVDREAAEALQGHTADPKRADQVLRPEKLAAGFAKPFHAFFKFSTDFGIIPPQLQGEPNYLVGIREVRGLHFACLNSAWFCRDSSTDRGNLWLGLPQLQSMPLCDPDDYDCAPVTLAVLHHPEGWLAEAENNAYENRPKTYRYLAERVHLILSGHTHGAIERPTRCYDHARLFLGGAAYDSHAYRNNFSVLQINPGARTIARRAWEFDPRGPVWEEKKPDCYTLRAEAPERGTKSPENYLKWLRGQTESIDLHQLKVGPGETPPPAMDSLYFELQTTVVNPRAEESAGRALERTGPVPLEEALRNRRLLVEGKPGSGKTTFLRRLAWLLCRPAGPPPELPVHGFPLLIRISQLDQHIAHTLTSRKPGDPAEPTDARWVPHFLAAQRGDLDEAFFLEKLGADDTVLLLDGLDEAANQARRVQMVQTIRRVGQFPCRMVVTTRPGGDEGRAALPGFEKAVIDELDDPGIDAFFLQWCRWLKRGDDTAAQAYYAELRPAVAVPSIRRLARNPLMLTVLAVLYLRRRRLPEQRAELYEQILDWLAEQAVDKHPEHSKDGLLRDFGYLALAMQEWRGGRKLQTGIDTAAGLLTPAPEQSIEPKRRFLEQAQLDSGIVTLRGGEIGFWHLSFQEYLAARTLAGFGDAKLWERAPKFLYSPEGREVLPLLAGRMAGSARERLDDLFDKLICDALSQQALERRAHAVGVVGNMLADVAPAKYALSGPAEQRFGELRGSVMAIFERGKTKGIGLKTRVAAAEALDQAAQSRLRTPGDEDYWVELRGGTFTSGDPEAYGSLPVKRIRVPAFRMGRFPVTVWEYGKYLEDSKAEEPPKWEQQAEHPGRPVVYVTWYEAQRYCEWASAKWNIRCALPTEEQWEFAARGIESRIYPWGGEEQEPDEHRANFYGMVGEPTPVGLFPDGSTPDGVADMAGNVWEWTRGDFDKDSKVMRGASFNGGATFLRAADRLVRTRQQARRHRVSVRPGIALLDVFDFFFDPRRSLGSNFSGRGIYEEIG